MKILLVEDDFDISFVVTEYLEDQNYIVELAEDGKTAWDLLEVFEYDLIILDLLLPKLDGLSLCRRLREKKNETLILIITPRDTQEDIVLGLDTGADDYLVKPFTLPELSARIRALLRRKNTALPPILEWGNLRLNPSTCEVFYSDKFLALSPKEYQLLDFFMRNPRRVFSRSQMLDRLWTVGDSPEEGTIKTHIRSLRQKLSDIGGDPDMIETIYGLGYRLKESSEPELILERPPETEQLNREEKREKVIAMLNDPQYATWSNRQIADACGVTHPTVSKLRNQLQANGNFTTES